MQDPLLDSTPPGGHPIDVASAAPAALAALVLTVVAIALAIVLWRRVGRLQRRIDDLTRGESGRNLEAVLDAHLERVVSIGGHVDDLVTRTTRLEASSRRAFQRAGLVRYNPFEETGGNQSFALALLDADDDGLIISSLHARSGTRIYARTLTAGRTDGALSAEEAEALALARAATKGRPASADHPASDRPGGQ
ncbi:MAG: DUF4446 family protein [Candidatus Limnocylindrales bacterium]